MKTTDEIRVIWDNLRYDLSRMDKEEKIYWMTVFANDVFDNNQDLLDLIEMLQEEYEYKKE